MKTAVLYAKDTRPMEYELPEGELPQWIQTEVYDPEGKARTVMFFRCKDFPCTDEVQVYDETSVVVETRPTPPSLLEALGIDASEEAFKELANDIAGWMGVWKESGEEEADDE